MDEITFQAKFHKLDPWADGEYPTVYGRRAARRTQKVHFRAALSEYEEYMAPMDCGDWCPHCEELGGDMDELDCIIEAVDYGRNRGMRF